MIRTYRNWHWLKNLWNNQKRSDLFIYSILFKTLLLHFLNMTTDKMKNLELRKWETLFLSRAIYTYAICLCDWWIKFFRNCVERLNMYCGTLMSRSKTSLLLKKLCSCKILRRNRSNNTSKLRTASCDIVSLITQLKNI